jgi:hypothetical protein
MVLKILVIVPCGKAKIWDRQPNRGPTKARSAYIGAPFIVNKTFAEKFADKWVILSAKYGFIDSDFVIPENYNTAFKNPSTNPISVNALRKQVKEKNLQNYDFVVALGGEDYLRMIKQAFQDVSKVIAPAQGLPLGKAMSHVKALSKLGKKEMLKRIGIS